MVGGEGGINRANLGILLIDFLNFSSGPSKLLVIY